MKIKPNKQPCQICKNHKPAAPFYIRDDSGKTFAVSHICNCPFCGRFLSENYIIGVDLADADDKTTTAEVQNDA